MTGTGWCDRAGALVVARVRHCAAACGTQLRLVVTAEGVRRMLALDGLDRLIPIYPSLENAVTATAAHSDGFCDTPARRPDATSEVRSSREQFYVPGPGWAGKRRRVAHAKLTDRALIAGR